MFLHSFLPITASIVFLVSPSSALGGWMPDHYGGDGWREVMRAEGDLNKDEIHDLALVLEAPEGVTEPKNACDPQNAFSEAPTRRLIIAFGDGAGGYNIVEDDPKVLLRADEGGVFGDPLEDLRIERGSVVISYFAGSRWRWGITERFRFQDGGFYLIGLTEFSLDSVSNATITYDYNPLSEKLLVSVEESPDAEMRLQEPTCIQCLTGENCPQANGCYAGTRRMETGEKWFTIGPRPLIALSQYRCWQEDTGLMDHAGFTSGR